MSDLTGVPSLSTAHRQVLLKGRGKGKTIKDLRTVEEGVRKKKRKWGLISDTEDDSEDSSEEFVEVVPKLATRSTPRRKAGALTPRMKMMKVVERERQSPDSDLSPVPPVRKVSVGGHDDHQQGTQMISQGAKCTYLNYSDNKAVDQVKNNNTEVTEESDVIKQVGSNDIDKDDMEVKDISDDKQFTNVRDPVVTATKPCAVGVSLPPGYGADKLAMVLMRLLEEKIKVSTSHSERELFRKTIHVLVCGGCKDREKHNKVRCRRCEERDRRKVEDRKKEKGKDKDKNIIKKRKVVGEKNVKITNKTTFSTITKGSPTKPIIKGPTMKPQNVRNKEKSKMTDCVGETRVSPSCCEKDGQKLKQLEDFKDHDHEQVSEVTSSEMTDSTQQKCLDLQTDENRTTKKDARQSEEGGESLENKENLVDTDAENHAVGNGASVCATIEDKVEGTLKEGLDEDLGMIDRDRIFSDLDDPVEDLSFDDLVLDTVKDAAHVEPIHDDEIDTELVIGEGLGVRQESVDGRDEQGGKNEGWLDC